MTWPASVAALARMQWLPTWLSWPMWAQVISRQPEPTRVMPPPPAVPRLMVTHLADGVVVADLGLSGLAFVLQVLRRDADGREGIKRVARSDARAAVEHHVRDEIAVFAQHHLRTDGAERPNCAGPGTTAPAAMTALGWMLTRPRFRRRRWSLAQVRRLALPLLAFARAPPGR